MSISFPQSSYTPAISTDAFRVNEMEHARREIELNEWMGMQRTMPLDQDRLRREELLFRHRGEISSAFRITKPRQEIRTTCVGRPFTVLNYTQSEISLELVPYATVVQVEYQGYKIRCRYTQGSEYCIINNIRFL